MATFDDSSPMPFGIHKEKALENVPASYLLWLWNNGKKKELARIGPHGDLARYIHKNLAALSQEDPDTIVDKPSS